MINDGGKATERAHSALSPVPGNNSNYLCLVSAEIVT